MATAYETDNKGKFIPASQRPDGTWRKARRVKDGYVPQDEVPLYESKGKQFSKRPESGCPVGLPAEFIAAAKQKREKEKGQTQKAPPSAASTKKNPVPGVLNITTKFEPVKKPRFPPTENSLPPPENDVANITGAMEGVTIDVRQEISKKLKKLRKKIREIEEVEFKLSTGEVKKLERDQQEKVRKKQEIFAEIKELEDQRKALGKADK